ncbi:MAG: hypothetical protein MPL62_08865 [Alphaproteobacteria bacterium]|nr:hypothetical protein [Alphaproteobacteria bacterium]
MDSIETDAEKEGDTACITQDYTNAKKLYTIILYNYINLSVYTFSTIPILFTLFYKGTAGLLRDHPSIADGDEDEALMTVCNKDTGDKCRLRMWSRGHLFIVRSCGHIDTWKPLYK